MTTRTLDYYTDPAHGWLAVDRADLDRLDITRRISPYSYQQNDKVYLEEDLDMMIFMEAAKDHGWVVNMKYQYTDKDSRIRSLPRFQP
jgi:hypothetical protein